MYNEPIDFPTFEFVYSKSQIREMIQEINSRFEIENEEENHNCGLDETGEGYCGNPIHYRWL